MFSCFSEIAKLFSRVAVSLCLPINPHIEYKRSISLQPCQQFLLSFWFFNCSNVQWFLLVVLICLSLMAYNVRHFYVLFAKHISSLLAVSSCLLPIARKKKKQNPIIVWLHWILSSLYILVINPISDLGFANIFSQSVISTDVCVSFHQHYIV